MPGARAPASRTATGRGAAVGDRFHVLLAAFTVAIALALVLAASGVAMSASLLVLALAPAVTVVGYETIGHRHMHVAVERSISGASAPTAAP